MRLSISINSSLVSDADRLEHYAVPVMLPPVWCLQFLQVCNIAFYV